MRPLKVKRIGKTNRAYRVYLPQHIGQTFEGEVEALDNAVTLTLIKPGTPLEQVEHSLEIMLDDIRLRQGKSKLRELIKKGGE